MRHGGARHSGGTSAAADLARELERLGLDVPGAAVDALLLYLSELDRWNQKMNLTALSGSMRIRRLVAEPLWIGRQLNIGGRCMDIGSGNGSPAIPMAVFLPISRITLVEPRLKRAAFLRYVLSLLRLPGATVERERIGEDANNPRNSTSQSLSERKGGGEGTSGVEPGLDWVTLQGVALTTPFLAALNRVCSRGTKIVWITAGAGLALPEARMIQPPDSSTEAWTFMVGESGR
jgi:hypothetical protein